MQLASWNIAQDRVGVTDPSMAQLSLILPGIALHLWKSHVAICNSFAQFFHIFGQAFGYGMWQEDE